VLFCVHPWPGSSIPPLTMQYPRSTVATAGERNPLIDWML
jgi:hypothetical protein